MDRYCNAILHGRLKRPLRNSDLGVRVELGVRTINVDEVLRFALGRNIELNDRIAVVTRNEPIHRVNRRSPLKQLRRRLCPGFADVVVLRWQLLIRALYIWIGRRWCTGRDQRHTEETGCSQSLHNLYIITQAQGKIVIAARLRMAFENKVYYQIKARRSGP